MNCFTDRFPCTVSLPQQSLPQNLKIEEMIKFQFLNWENT